MATMNTEDLIEVCSETKCPYRRMYLGALRKLIGNFHQPRELFKKCSHCRGFGHYEDRDTKRGTECIEYPLILDAREFAKNQAVAVVRTAAGD